MNEWLLRIHCDAIVTLTPPDLSVRQERLLCDSFAQSQGATLSCLSVKSSFVFGRHAGSGQLSLTLGVCRADQETGTRHICQSDQSSHEAPDTTLWTVPCDSEPTPLTFLFPLLSGWCHTNSPACDFPFWKKSKKQKQKKWIENTSKMIKKVYKTCVKISLLIQPWLKCTYINDSLSPFVTSELPARRKLITIASSSFLPRNLT